MANNAESRDSAAPSSSKRASTSDSNAEPSGSGAHNNEADNETKSLPAKEELRIYKTISESIELATPVASRKLDAMALKILLVEDANKWGSNASLRSRPRMLPPHH